MNINYMVFIYGPFLSENKYKILKTLDITTDRK